VTPLVGPSDNLNPLSHVAEKLPRPDRQIRPLFHERGNFAARLLHVTPDNCFVKSRPI